MKSHIYFITFLIVPQAHLFLHHSPFGPVVFIPHRLLWPLKKENKYIQNKYSFERLQSV